MRGNVDVVALVVSVKRGFATDLDAHERFLVVGDVAVGGFEAYSFFRNVVVFRIFYLDPPRHPQPMLVSLVPGEVKACDSVVEMDPTSAME